MYRVCFRNICGLPFVNCGISINGIPQISNIKSLYISDKSSLLFVQLKRTYSLSANNEKWDLMSAVCVERRPIITKPFNQLESKVYKLLNEMETERSHKSDHEIRHELDKQLLLAKTKESAVDPDETTHQTAQEFEDAVQEEYNKFKFAKRTTPADEKNDMKSLDRKLDHNLVLLIKENIGNDIHWIFPQSIRQEGETMRQTAERVLTEKCGDELKTVFIGNAPCGFYKYKYPKNVQKSSEITGAKIFFFKAQFLNGSVNNNLCKDYQWASLKELNILHPDYRKSVVMFLIS